MPYKDNSGLPDSVKSHLPEHAQDIYREAYNHAYVEYKGPKQRCDHSSRKKVCRLKTKLQRNETAENADKATDQIVIASIVLFLALLPKHNLKA